MTLKELLSGFSGAANGGTGENYDMNINVADPDVPNGITYVPTAMHCPAKLLYREVDNFSFEVFEDGVILVVHLKPVTYLSVCVYCDSTGLFSEEECDRENTVDINFPEHIVRAWYEGHTDTEKTFDAWLDTFTTDDTDGLYQFAAKYGFTWKRPTRQYLVRVVCEYEVFVDASSEEEAECNALDNYLEKSNGIPDEVTAEVIDTPI